jgi:hypothetical protein
LEAQGNKFILYFRLPSGESLNILEPFRTAFPEYFYIRIPKKEEFLDVLCGKSDS